MFIRSLWSTLRPAPPPADVVIGNVSGINADIATVARLAEHANVKTTAGYNQRGEDRKKRAAVRLHYPF